MVRRATACLGIIILASAAAPAVWSAEGLDLDAYELVDLTHPFNDETIYWPTSPAEFHLERLAYGMTEKGYFYAAHTLATPEHGGTHLDAPIHFGAGKRTTAEIPLAQLIAPAIVIDVTDQAATDRDYRLTAVDVLQYEKRHGRIEPGTIVLLRTGWSRFWPDRKRYLGDDTPGDASNLHFPAFGEESARLLVEQRKVAVLGTDTASIDHGPSASFVVHQIASASNVPALENLTRLETLPARGALLIALPMKIEGGSGGPLRAVALVPKK